MNQMPVTTAFATNTIIIHLHLTIVPDFNYAQRNSKYNRHNYNKCDLLQMPLKPILHTFHFLSTVIL